MTVDSPIAQLVEALTDNVRGRQFNSAWDYHKED